MNLIDRKGEVITNQPPQGLTRDPYASEEFVVEAEGKTGEIRAFKLIFLFCQKLKISYAPILGFGSQGFQKRRFWKPCEPKHMKFSTFGTSLNKLERPKRGFCKPCEPN